MDIRFAAESVQFALDRTRILGEKDDARASPYWLKGLACPHIDDDFGPADESKFLTTAQIWTMERMPLIATVIVRSEAEWRAQMVPYEVHFVESWRGEDGKVPDLQLVNAMVAANTRAAQEANAVVHYSPIPEPDEIRGSGRRRREARVQIVLRLRDEEMMRWNAFCGRFIGVDLPPCSVVAQDLVLGDSDTATAEDGLPTWSRFISGQMSVQADGGFNLRVATDWDDLAF